MPVRRSVKSESGASMSQYDQEVEKRLKVLEEGAHAHKSNSGGSDEGLAKRIQIIEEVLRANPQNNFDKMSEKFGG